MAKPRALDHATFLKNVNWRHWCVIAAVPLVTLVIAARQHYLHRAHDLSVWKGGGMGMFAAEQNVNRFTKTYIVSSSGSRHPVVEFTMRQRKLVSALQNYPSEENFLQLVENMRRTWWVSSKGKFPLRVIDKSGKLVSVQPDKQFYLRADAPRGSDENFNSQIQVEFWKGTYDPETRLVSVSIDKTFTYPKD